MDAISGIANDGLLIEGWRIKEMPAWFEVQVTFDDPDDTESDLTYETWYFFKPQS